MYIIMFDGKVSNFSEVMLWGPLSMLRYNDKSRCFYLSVYL